MIRSHPSAVMSSTGVNDSMPALVTRISTGPSSARMRPNAASTDARSATSTSRASTCGALVAQPVGCGLGSRSVPVDDGDAVTLGHEPTGHAEADARGTAGDDGDPAHRPASTGSNSMCRLLSPRRIQVGS